MPGRRKRRSSLPREARELLAHLRQSSKAELPQVQHLLGTCREAANAREDNFGWQPLMFAAHVGNAALLGKLLDAGADLHARCEAGCTALHMAARCGHLAVLDHLLQRGANLDARSDGGRTPLMWSSIGGFLEAVAALAEASAEVDAKDDNGRTACMWAAQHGHTTVVRRLLISGVDLSICDNDGRALEEYADDYDRLCNSVKGLEARRGVETPSQAIADAFVASLELIAFAEAGDWKAVDDSLKAGACVSTRAGPLLRSPLAWAAIHGAPSASKTLCWARAQLEGRDSMGWTALHYAVHVGSGATVSMLCYIGADFASTTDSGDTVLHLAARADAAAMLQLLHPVCQDLSVLDGSDHTPLQAATMCGCAASVQTLLALHADVSCRDVRGRSLFAVSMVHGHIAVAHAMLEPLREVPQPWHEDKLGELLQRLPGVSTVSAQPPGTKKQRKQRVGAKPAGLRAIAEVAEVESSDSSECGRPASRQSRASGRPLSARSNASGQSRTSAQSRASARSRGSSRSVASTRSKGSTYSLASLRSKSSTSGQTRLTAAGLAAAGAHNPDNAVGRPRSSKPAASTRSADRSEGGSGFSRRQLGRSRSGSPGAGCEASQCQHIRSKGGSRSGSPSCTSSRSNSRPSSRGSTGSRASVASSRESVASSRISAKSAVSRMSGSSAASSCAGSRGRRTVGRKAGSKAGSKTNPVRGGSRRGGSGVRRLSGNAARPRAAANVADHPAGLLLAACEVSARLGEVVKAAGPALTTAAAMSTADNDGRSPLALAVAGRHADLVCWLLQHRAPVDAADASGSTALMLAAAKPDMLATIHLLEARADVNIRDKRGRTAADVCPSADLRKALQTRAEREAVESRMQRSCSLPAISKSRSRQ